MENPILPGEIPQISTGFSSAIHRWPVPLSAALTFTMPLASMSKVTSILPRERHVNATSGAWRFYPFCIWLLCFYCIGIYYYYTIYIYIYTIIYKFSNNIIILYPLLDGAPVFDSVKRWFIFVAEKTMVYGRYNELVNGDYFMVYKPT